MMLFDRLQKIYAWTPRCNRLLDVGCDRAALTNEFTRKAKHVYGIDNNSEAIAQGKRYKKINLFVAKGEKIPFKNEFFDVVVMGDVLEHVIDEQKTLNEVYRVMKKGGTLVVSVPHKGLFRCIDTFNMKFYFPKLYRWWKGRSYNPRIYQIQPWHRHYSLHDLSKLFGDQFEITRVHKGGFLLYPLCWLFADLSKDLLGERLGWLRKISVWIGHVEYNTPFGVFGYSILTVAKK